MASVVAALQPLGSRSPFVWIHGEQSNAVLANYLGPDQPLYAVLHQSHDGQRAQFTRMEDIAACYLEEVRRVQPRGPYRLGGFCVGATLAFEMARQLESAGECVTLLIMLDPPVTGPNASPLARISRSDAPPLNQPGEPARPAFAKWAARQLGQLARLDRREKLAYVVDGVVSRSSGAFATITRKASGVLRSASRAPAPERAMDPDRRIRYINAVHYRAKLGYQPGAYGGRVVVLKTDGGCQNPEAVWGPVARGGLEVIELPGRHTEIVVDRQQIETLAVQLKACLDAVDAGPMARV
jgi:thioesterase domain-containing protein